MADAGVVGQVDAGERGIDDQELLFAGCSHEALNGLGFQGVTAGGKGHGEGSVAGCGDLCDHFTGGGAHDEYRARYRTGSFTAMSIIEHVW